MIFIKLRLKKFIAWLNFGNKGSTTSFIFSDNSIKEEAFLEDINNILNTGEVPKIFPAEEKAEV